MDAIAEYVRAKQDIAAAKKWEALIGSPYQGGDKGIGRVAALDTVDMRIFHQYSNTSDIYHKIPCDHLAACIRLVATDMAPTIISQAIAIMERGLKNKADAAKVLADAIAADASA